MQYTSLKVDPSYSSGVDSTSFQNSRKVDEVLNKCINWLDNLENLIANLSEVFAMNSKLWYFFLAQKKPFPGDFLQCAIFFIQSLKDFHTNNYFKLVQDWANEICTQISNLVNLELDMFKLLVLKGWIDFQDFIYDCELDSPLFQIANIIKWNEL